MASPQVEDGYTRIANELLDAIISYPFSRREYAIVMAVIRVTYGFNKKEDAISGWQLSEKTGIDRSHVSKTITDLVAKQVLIRSDSGRISHGQNIPFLSINKHYQQWATVAEKATVARKPTVAVLSTVAETAPLPNQPHTVAETATETVAVLATRPLPKQPTHKDIPKDIKDIPKDMTGNTPPAPAEPDRKAAEAETALQTACRQTWSSYSQAFHARYNTAPNSNATVRSQVKSFVKRIGHEESPQIAAWFVSHQEPFYVRKAHDFGLLLSDSHKLRTEWATGRSMAVGGNQSVQDARLDTADQIFGRKRNHGNDNKVIDITQGRTIEGAGTSVSEVNALLR